MMAKIDMKLSQALGYVRLGLISAREYPEKLEVALGLLDEIIPQVLAIEVPGGILGDKVEEGAVSPAQGEAAS